MPDNAPQAEPVARLELQPHSARLEASDGSESARDFVPWTELTGAKRINLAPRRSWSSNISRLATLACCAGGLGLLSAYVVSG